MSVQFIEGDNMAETLRVEIAPGNLIPDPNNVPVTFCNTCLGGGVVNGVINIAMGIARFTPTIDGKIDVDQIIAARLRMDVNAALALKQFIETQLAMLAEPQDKPN